MKGHVVDFRVSWERGVWGGSLPLLNFLGGGVDSAFPRRRKDLVRARREQKRAKVGAGF